MFSKNKNVTSNKLQAITYISMKIFLWRIAKPVYCIMIYTHKKKMENRTLTIICITLRKIIPNFQRKLHSLCKQYRTKRLKAYTKS